VSQSIQLDQTAAAELIRICGVLSQDSHNLGQRPNGAQAAIPIDVTLDELSLLIEALDSHEYWQLSESHERNDGYSMIEDGVNEEIDAVRELISKLETARSRSRA